MTEISLLAIVGGLRSGSVNAATARATAMRKKPDRPPKSWGRVPFTFVSISPGRRAGSYGDKIDNGELIDAETLTELTEFVGSFADFARSDVG